MENVRFFGGRKAEYVSIPKHNPIGLYFCADSRELFLGDRLLSDGLRVVQTFADLPSISEYKAAEGVIYFVVETRNGYVLPQGGSEWLQVIYASNSGAGTEVDLSNYYTKAEVDAAILNAITDIEINVDLDDYATKEEVAAVEAKIPSTEGLATKQELKETIAGLDIPEAEIYKVDFNAPDYAKAVEAYNSGKILVLTGAAPDINSFAVMNYVSEKYITFTKFLMSRSGTYGAFNTYYLSPENAWEVSKEVKLNKVEITDEGKLEIGKQVLNVATEEYVAQKIAEAELAEQEVDLSAYYTKSETETAISAAVDAIKVPDITNLATKSELEAVQTTAGNNSVKLQLVDSELFDVNEKINNLPEVPVKVSELENDRGYITVEDIPEVDLNGYATETWVQDQGYLTEHQSLADYAKKDELFSKSYNDLTNKPVIPSINGLASEEFVTNAIKAIEIPEVPENISAFTNDAGYLTEHQSLNGYAKVEDLPDFSNFAIKAEIPTLEGYAKTTDIPDVSKFITEVPAEYITETELSSKGFITKHQDISHLATKEELPDVSNFITLSDVEAKGYITEIPSNLITEDELAAKGFLTEHQDLSEYAKRNELPSVEGLASEEYVANAIANISFPETDLSEYSKTVEITSAITTAVAEKADEKPFQTAKYVTNAINGFTVGEDISGFTIATLFAKLLGLSDTKPGPVEPEIPDESEGIIEEIIANKLPMYSVNADGTLTAMDFAVTSFTPEEATAAPVESGFYQIVENGTVVESGYQDLMIANDDMYYVVAFPKGVDYDTMVKMQTYDDEEQKWLDNSKKLALTSDPDVVASLCDEAGIDISHINTEFYTVWALEDTCNGKKIRYIIEETK